MSKIRILRWTAIGTATLAAAAVIALVSVVRLSLPEEDGTHLLSGLTAAVEINFDAHHIPTIHADSRRDAYEALGYVTARDRFFQMDLSRRRSSGRLAEIFGASAAKADVSIRLMGLERLASAVIERLPAEQRDVLVAYSAGVNNAVSEMRLLPVEFTLLGYRPEHWRPEDCVLVLLGLAAQHSNGIVQERMASVMRRALPQKIVEFLTPDGDCYNEMLAPRNPSRCSADSPAPLDEIARLLGAAEKGKTFGLVTAPEAPQGSNGWVVGPQKSHDGRAIMANDMHLGLSAPGVWYRAELHYGASHLRGLTIPGVPYLVAGSNGFVAWGFTSVEGDFSDLVRIERTADSSKYRTEQGELAFLSRKETINIRGGSARELVVQETIWGPVAPDKLLDDEVAIRWTILDPAATNFDLLNMDRIANVHEALSLFHHAGGPPLNVLLADSAGNIAWTIMGRLPKRFGMNGLFSESWTDGSKGWRGYFSEEETPSIVNPPSGFLVNTNNRMLGVTEFKPEIGHDFSGGFRAWKVTEWLRSRSKIAETDMLSLQLDTATDYYRYYQNLALRALDSRPVNDSNLSEIRRYLEAWDGRAEADSLGLPLIVEFHKALVDAVISPIVARCIEVDPTFRYTWSGVDGPVQRIIDSAREDLLPERGAYRDWPSFIISVLEKSARRLIDSYAATSINDLTWGKINTVKVFHPTLGELPVIGRFFNMPVEPLAGCRECVRYSASRVGASARMVVSPGHERDGILELPAGQSGLIGSPYYGDQEASWVRGLPAGFLAGAGSHKVTLTPAEISWTAHTR
ncbi:MAG: penicillin acylase family protein [Roseiarcus sp.]